MRPFFGSQCFGPPAGVVYGPIPLSGLSRSLGVSFSPPGCRVCSFDCTYCHAGDGSREGRGVRWPSPGQIESEIANALPRVGPVEWITISGRGEPTLHPRFPAALSAVLGPAERSRPRIRVRIFTNGAGVVSPEVRRMLDLLDERVVRVDANSARVNRPSARHPLGAVTAGLSLLSDISVQSCFLDGEDGNSDEPAVAEWADLLDELRPRRVEIFTVPEVEAAADVRPTDPGRLDTIARLLRERTGISASVL